MQKTGSGHLFTRKEANNEIRRCADKTEDCLARSVVGYEDSTMMNTHKQGQQQSKGRMPYSLQCSLMRCSLLSFGYQEASWQEGGGTAHKTTHVIATASAP